MSITKNYKVGLKLCVSKWGVFENISILKGRSEIDEDLLTKINIALQQTFVPAPPIKTNVEIGDAAEQKVMQHLLNISQNNIDFEVNDTSNLLNHGDISVKHQDKLVCIEVKCYSKPVPMREVEKYRMSLNHTEYNCGIMLQMQSCGFAKECGIKTPIDFRIDNGKPSIYLTNIDLSILYPVLAMLIACNNISNTVDNEELEKKRSSLLEIHEQVLAMRVMIEHQKKLTEKMEASINNIIKLSLD